MAKNPWPSADSFALRIELGNSDMQTKGDVSRALIALARRLATAEGYDGEGTIRDVNGNLVGRWQLQRGR